MGEIRLPGLSTGIDTSALISQLMAVERRTLTVYENRKKIWQDRQQSLDTLETKLGNLRSSVRALADADALKAFNVASSDSDEITAKATSNAYEGTHTIIVNRLATAERWVHTAGKEYAEDYVGEGTFIYAYNHKETVIDTTATTTLNDLVGLINNDANNPGVTASLLYYNDAYHLVLNGNDAGTDYAISINDSSTEVWQADTELTYGSDNAALSTRLELLDQFSGTLSGDETIEITGTDDSGVAIAPVTLNVTANTKVSHLIDEINDAFDGVAEATFENGKIVLTSDTAGTSQLSISLTYDDGDASSALTLPTMAVSTEGGSTTADLAGFAAADFTETQSAQDSQIRVDGYPAGAWIERSSNTIDDVISGVTLQLHDVTDETGETITLSRDIESVKEKVDSMVLAYNEAIDLIKEKTGYNDVTQTAGILMGNYVVSTIQYKIREPIIERTVGFVEDVDAFLSPLGIGFDIDKDGHLSFDTNTFDEAIAENYLGVLSILGADKTGSSSSSVIDFYQASSDYTAAGEYNVQVEVSGGAIVDGSAKIKLSSEATWRDMTVSEDNILMGNSTFDDNGNPIYSENGLLLSVDLTTDGTYTATVRVKQGFAGKIEDAIDDMLRVTTGSIQIDQEHVSDQIEEIDEKIESEQDRLKDTEERLIARFARLEKSLSILQQQMASAGLLSNM